MVLVAKLNINLVTANQKLFYVIDFIGSSKSLEISHSESKEYVHARYNMLIMHKLDVLGAALPLEFNTI